MNAMLVVLLGAVFMAASWRIRSEVTAGDTALISISQGNALRGIAIFVILLGHIGNYSGVRYFNPLGKIGVGIFLILSGYGLNESWLRNGLKDFFRKRVHRVLLPYWIVIAGFLLWTYIFGGGSHLAQWSLQLLLINLPTPVYWYVQYIVIWYIIFFMLWNWLDSPRARMLGCIAAGTIFAFLLPNHLMAEQSFLFAFGVALSYKKEMLTKFFQKDGRALVTGSILAALAVFVLAVKQLPAIRSLDGTIAYDFVHQTMIVCAALGIMIIAAKMLKQEYQRVARLLGKNAYELYLVHALFLPLFLAAHSFAQNVTVFIALTFIGTIALRLVLVSILDRPVFGLSLSDTKVER